MRVCIACHSSLRSALRMIAPVVILFSASFFPTENIHAQTSAPQQEVAIAVRGQVVGEDKKPLEGVSVQVKGSSAGTTTNSNGEFELSFQSKNSSVLVFTY